MKTVKVFGVGFHKTATSSLADALKILGYSVTGPNWVEDPTIADTVLSKAMDLAEQYDAFQDNPWPLLYREMDQRFPGSKFILTMRSPDKWIRSVVRHFGTQKTPMREWIYGFGCPLGNEEVYLERYERHNREVMDYFRDRPDDLMLMDIPEGDGWDKLCPFLGTKVPQVSFPHSNPASSRPRSAALSNAALRTIHKTKVMLGISQKSKGS